MEAHFFKDFVRSLKFRVFTLSFIAVAALSFILSYIFIGDFYKESENSLLRSANLVGDLLSRQLAAPMDLAQLLGDTSEGEQLLDSAVSNKSLVYAVAYDADGNLFAKAGKLPDKFDRAIRDKYLKKSTHYFDHARALVHAKSFIRGDKGKGESKIMGALYLGMSRAQTDASVARIKKEIVLWTVALASLFILLYFLMVLKSTVRPIVKITRVLRKVGEGDLSEVGRMDIGTNTRELVDMYTALINTTETFRENLLSISQVASNLNTTSDVILSTSKLISEVGQEQARALSETTSTIEEIEKTGHMTARNAKDIQSDAHDTQQLSRQGLHAVDETKQRLEKIHRQVQQIVEDANTLHEQLTEADRIIASVAGVTQQSHTLSINASIEAIKAGEAGKGFAVVAREIRNLSTESRRATDEVQRTLTNIQEGINTMVIASDNGLSAAEAGVTSMDQTAALIRQVEKSIEKSTLSAQSIAHNTTQQATGLEQGAKAMTGINVGTQKHLESIEFLETSGSELQRHSSSLQSLVDLFKVD